ncbi:MAG TPA: hypothetical protein VH561_14200 [Micromonosporaceae bacterium]
MAGPESWGDTVALDAAPAEQLASGPPPGARWRIVASVLALVLACAAGAAFGLRSGSMPRLRVDAMARLGADIWSTGQQCSTQAGSMLWLGIEVVNTGPGVVTPYALSVHLPVGGFDVVGTYWGMCGKLYAISDPGPPRPPALARNETAWLSAVLYPRDSCPTSYPVRFQLSYVDSHGALASGRDVGGFDNLEHVSFIRCPAS